MNCARTTLASILVGSCLFCAAQEYDRFGSLKTSWDPYLQSLDEPGLCEFGETEGQIYRLIHEPAFELAAVIILEIPENEPPTITLKTGRVADHGNATTAAETSRARLERGDVMHVLRLLQEIDFWRAKSEARPIEDGTFVYLEGVRNRSCHYLIWISPQDENVKELTTSLFALTQVQNDPHSRKEQDKSVPAYESTDQ